ncbi:MAG TPA: hypothetical protein VLM89_15240, partial [Phycisphaerae bacterium]|nr:hypothetical protein [Phycisphaerae bacterium]
NRGSPIGFFDPVVKPDNREFSYELETVGPILETNGRRIADNKVRWTFSVADLWPNGYRMTATAVRWNREAERKLFGRVVLTDVEVVLMVREAVTRHENVRNALKQSIEKGNLGPLQTLGAAGEADEHKAARDILKLATRPAS